MQPIISLEWQFGGWLRHWPASAAWGVMAVLAALGLWLVFRSYHRTAGDLPPATSVALAAVRGAMLLVLLVCLANPTRVLRNEPSATNRELMVLVDRSASMSQPDHRGATRLADAVRTWKEHEAEAAANFSEVKHERFAVKLDAAASLDDAVKSAAPGPETHLYAALRRALDEKPAAIVCLTDGLDTSSDKPDNLVAAATDRGVPLYFVVGNNRARAGGEVMKIREVKIPAQVLRQSRFTASALVEVITPTAREIPLELWNGGTMLASTRKTVKPGLNEIPWSVEVASGEPSLMPLEFRIGTGARQQIAGRTTRVVENTSVDLLYYQGALQWGYRFLRGALESDPSFHITAILNPALGVQLTSGSEGQPTLADLPEDARELKRFQLVVLAHAFADLLSAKQQQALLEYARGGGGVLFISPDTEATRRFSGTALEEMLPVVFEHPGSPGQHAAEERFQERMRALGGASSGDESQFANETLARQKLPELTPLKIVPGSASARLFPASADVPRFNTYARVRAVKPGAEVLAVHPTDRGPDNAPRVLVARQRFGDGFTAVMNTDLLWRWKLSLASTNRSVEMFWQQFFLSLAQPTPGRSVEIAGPTEPPQTGHSVTLRVSGTADSTPALVARSPENKIRKLSLTPAEANGASVWQASFTPETEGCWEATASLPSGEEAKMTIPVARQVQTAELLNLPADVDGLRRLAEATGGALIESGRQAFNQHPMEPPAQVLPAKPLWNNGWIVASLLGLYATELVSRRRFKLL